MLRLLSLSRKQIATDVLRVSHKAEVTRALQCCLGCVRTDDEASITLVELVGDGSILYKSRL